MIADDLEKARVGGRAQRVRRYASGTGRDAFLTDTSTVSISAGAGTLAWASLEPISGPDSDARRSSASRATSRSSGARSDNRARGYSSALDGSGQRGSRT